jgi:hypothetical protein
MYSLGSLTGADIVSNKNSHLDSDYIKLNVKKAFKDCRVDCAVYFAVASREHKCPALQASEMSADTFGQDRCYTPYVKHFE